MGKYNLELAIDIDTVDGAAEIPIDDSDAFQVRQDGVFLDGKLYLWEDIKTVTITNVSTTEEDK